jgi:hypothetical protein
MLEKPTDLDVRVRRARGALLTSLLVAVVLPAASAQARSRPVKPPRVCPIAVAAARHPESRTARRRTCASPRRRNALRNSFGQSLFGIATGSTLQNEVVSPRLLQHDLSIDKRAGARWVRIDINWAQIQMHGPNTYLWTYIDTAVRRAESAGMHVLGTIAYTPSWAVPPGKQANWGPDPALYARFAAAAVKHYAALGVQDYEIWNEPNSAVFWAPRPNPTAYTRMLRDAYVAIKAVDPFTVVMTGGTAPAATDGRNYSPVDWLAQIYRHGGHGFFDAVGHHPYCWPAYPGAKKAWSGWYQMYGTKPSLRSLMVAHGDGAKKIWATEFGAPTNGPAGTFVSRRTQAKMVTRAYRLFATYRWAGPLFFYSSRDQGSATDNQANFFGFLTRSFARKPSFTAYRRAALSVRALVRATRSR